MKENKMRETYDEIDLYDYLRVIWRWRWLIAIGVIAVTLVSIPVAYLMRSYESKGVLRVGELSVPAYKTYSENFLAPDLFLRYAKTHDVIPEADIASLEALRQRDSLGENVEAVYAYGAEEIEAGVAQFEPEKQYVTTLRLNWKMSSPLVAQQMVAGLGNFIKYSIEQKVLDDYVKGRYEDVYINVRQLENKLTNLDFSLKQKQQKLKDLKRIAERFPHADNSSAREVVSVEKGGHLYLSPSAQMVATDASISETKLEMTDTKRDLKINKVRLELFSALKEGIKKEKPDDLFAYLNALKEEFFRDKDLKQEEISLVRNEVFTDFARFEHRFNDVMQFISGPTLPQKAKPSKRMVVAVTFFLGLFCFTFLAFFLEFIQRGRQREMMEGKKKSKK
jgi:LPS O-antigen subunit length determinant protein (WzzB/FepE family)